MILGMYNATKVVGFPDPNVLLHSASLEVKRGQRLGIAAGPNSGKSTIARILSNREHLDSGAVVRFGTVSWPLGFAGVLNANLTAVQNIKFIADMLSYDPDETCEFCREFSELNHKFDNPVGKYSSSERGRLAFALSLAFEFDIYIVDETFSVGNQLFRDRCQAALEARIRDKTLIAFSRNIRSLEQYCSQFAVLTRGKFIPCAEAEEAMILLEVSGTTN